MIDNRTKIPTSLLAPIIHDAALCIGVDIVHAETGIGHVGIEIAPMRSKWKWAYGAAFRLGNSGYIKIKVPVRSCLSPILLATDFRDLILHELAHIRDYQGKSMPGPAGWDLRSDHASRRRMVHHLRPQEIRAELAVDAAHSLPMSIDIQDAILELGIWYEENRASFE